MRQYKNRRVVRRVVAPPTFPGIILPRASNRSEHVSPQNPGADIFEGLSGKIVIHALRPAALAVHLPKHFGVLKPLVQFEAANSSGLFKSCRGPAPNPSSEIENAATRTWAHGQMAAMSTDILGKCDGTIWPSRNSAVVTSRPAFECQHFHRSRLRGNNPNFGNSQAFVILQLLGTLGARIGGRKNFHDQLRRRMNVPVLFHNVAPDKYRDVRHPRCERIALDHQAEIADAHLDLLRSAPAFKRSAKFSTVSACRILLGGIFRISPFTTSSMPSASGSLSHSS